MRRFNIPPTIYAEQLSSETAPSINPVLINVDAERLELDIYKDTLHDDLNIQPLFSEQEPEPQIERDQDNGNSNDININQLNVEMGRNDSDIENDESDENANLNNTFGQKQSVTEVNVENLNVQQNAQLQIAVPQLADYNDQSVVENVDTIDAEYIAVEPKIEILEYNEENNEMIGIILNDVLPDEEDDDIIEIGVNENGFPVPFISNEFDLIKQENDIISGKIPFKPSVSSI